MRFKAGLDRLCRDPHLPTPIFSFLTRWIGFGEFFLRLMVAFSKLPEPENQPVNPSTPCPSMRDLLGVDPEPVEWVNRLGFG